MTESRTVRPGAASAALLLIMVITAAWWALALWPAGAVEPAWLLRTRAACFGSAPGGLPDTGGWILLIGEPIGMLGVLVAIWGGALREDLRRIRASRRWRRIATAVVIVALAGMAALGRRVAFAAGLGAGEPVSLSTVPTPTDIDITGFGLVDQDGRPLARHDFQGRPAILTFAFGHCATVCPAIVHDLRVARAAANRPDLPLLVVSLDPWRDQPEQLQSVAVAWQLSPGDRVLSGTVADVERALDALGINRRRDEATGNIDHVATVMGIDTRGRAVWRLDGGWGNVQELVAAMPVNQ